VKDGMSASFRFTSRVAYWILPRPSSTPALPFSLLLQMRRRTLVKPLSDGP